ncbi:MAG: HNH endonuclease [Corynebacterium sp.]|nr:HNH endonuclease [Corynebacterium sp.]
MREKYLEGASAGESPWEALIGLRRDGWALLKDLGARLEMQPLHIIARDAAMAEAEARDLRRIYRRIKPCAALAEKLKLPLGHLQAISIALGTVQPRHNDMIEVLTRMLNAAADKTLADATFAVRDIAASTARPDNSERKNRFNFAKEENHNHMVHGHGVFQAHAARQIEHLAQPYIDGRRQHTPEITYDQALGEWIVNRLLTPSKKDGEASASDGDEGEKPTEYQPVIIISGDPNVDFDRGVINTLDGGTLPIAEAVNARLAGTGWVCHTSLVDGKAQLNFITPIIRERFSTGTHRLGVMLETLVCARCHLPATRCQAHHINAYHYHPQETHTWNDLTNLCKPHNTANDDDPSKEPYEGRVNRDKDGWPMWEREPGGERAYNGDRKFRQGWRGTTHDMADNERTAS